VAHSLSAKKRIRQNVKRNARNRARKEGIKTEVKALQASLTGGDFAKAAEQLKAVSQKLMRVATKGTIHRNAANRKRSRLAKRINAAKSAKAGAGTPAKA
jgi:small subunit ribosomal protein S20